MSDVTHDAAHDATTDIHPVSMWEDFDDLPAPEHKPALRAIPLFQYKKAKIGTLVRHKDFPERIYPIYAFIWFGPHFAVEVSLPDGNRRWTIFAPDCEVLVQVASEAISEDMEEEHS